MDSDTEREQQPRYIHFKFPGTQINQDEFESDRFLIPHIGEGVVSFTRARPYLADAKGMTVKNGQLVVDTAQAFSHQGLFDVILTIYGPKTDIKCILKVPQFNQELQSVAPSMAEEFETDELKANSCSTDYWNVGDSEEKYYIFVPNDPEFLNSLGFRFEAQTPIIPET